ncbi:hypothetical protein [Mycoplasma procyoni]|uniref:hypothetical protein n=1 Tax=Mycoplasma procyoni TaxID=568784 RepID=UPI00197B4A3D|nr:hypothetical protein [Mycoplasma procyoni]MBN3534894.1 hypothetical protein [Mycoplasma procyoni]
MFSKLSNFFSVYKYRKLFYIFSIIIAIIGFGLFFAFYDKIANYIVDEKVFYKFDTLSIEKQAEFYSKTSESYIQSKIFIGFWVICSLIWVTIITLSIYSLILLAQQKSNGYKIQKITTLLWIVIVILISILLSFIPPYKEEYNTKTQEFNELNPPNYVSGWFIFGLSVFVGLWGLISRKNYGFLDSTKAKQQKETKDAKKQNKKVAA